MICIIGGRGSVGSRYAAILRWHRIKHTIYDLDTLGVDIHAFNKYIICTPTDTHIHFLKLLDGKTILCEKPICKNPTEIPDMNNVYTVCNWNYVAMLMKQEPPFSISYDFFRTGPDGLYYDLAQILYMDPEAKISNKSPKWNVSINGLFVAYRTLEESYSRMLLDFSSGNYGNLWTLEQGKEMVETVLERITLDQRIIANG